MIHHRTTLALAAVFMLGSCSLMREPKLRPMSAPAIAKCDAPPGSVIRNRMERWIYLEDGGEYWDTLVPPAPGQGASQTKLPPGVRLKIMSGGYWDDPFDGGHVAELEVLSGPHRGKRFKSRFVYQLNDPDPSHPNAPRYPVLSKLVAVLEQAKEP